MKTQCANSNSFKGIQLSKQNFLSTKRVVKYLSLNDYHCAGKKTYFMQNNNLSDMRKKTDFIRNKYNFLDKEFGVVFFPWAKKTYILAKPLTEQTMLEWVKEMDPDACINLLI